MTEVLPAATVVVVREGRDAPELLLLRRNSKLAFHGGAWVFPGGRVDAHEGAGEPAARRAAVREAREEAGLELDPASLVQLSHWTTPEGQPRRFATWFFIAQLGRDEVRIDGGEIHEHRWFTADDALAAQRAKEIELPPPTFVTLVDAARAPLARRRDRRRGRARAVRLPAALHEARRRIRLALSRRRGLGDARSRSARRAPSAADARSGLAYLRDV